MSTQLDHSIFKQVLFPSKEDDKAKNGFDSLMLQKVMRFRPEAETAIEDLSLVVFDFETTGLDRHEDQIIEIGAIKLNKDLEPIDEFSCLIDPGMILNDAIIKLTGITNEMLVGQPRIDQVLEKFLEFIDRSVLVAHNADFDAGFLSIACSRQGYLLNWPIFCTLKMARLVLPDLPSKNLDTLSTHYGLTFESRHRSIGDVKVTAAVLKNMLAEQSSNYQTWGDLQPVEVNLGEK